MAEMQIAAFLCIRDWTFGVGRSAFAVLSLISQRSYGVQTRRRPRRREPGNQSRHHRNDHAREDEPDRKLDRERWKRLPNSETHHVCKTETDKSAKETRSSRFDEELQQDRPPARAECFACPDFLRPLFH